MGTFGDNAWPYINSFETYPNPNLSLLISLSFLICTLLPNPLYISMC